MALNFPTSPVTGQTYTYGTTTWQWDGSRWVMQAVTIQGPAGIGTALIYNQFYI